MMTASSYDMRRLDLPQLLAGTTKQSMPALTPVKITSDSRAIEPGSLFFALAGIQSHGMDYVDQAIEKKAIAIVAEPDERWPMGRLQDFSALPLIPVCGLSGKLSEIAGRFYQQPSQAMALIAITGTNGKTSVSHFLAQALGRYSTVGVIGTLGYGPLAALKNASHTTPDAIRLQAELAEMRTLGIQHVALEASSHALAQGRMAALAVKTAVFTNLSRDHLDFHQTMSAYAEAKALLLRQPGLKHVVINLDDEFGQALVKRLPNSVRLVAFGSMESVQSAEHFVRLVSVQTTVDGLTLQLATSWGNGGVTVPLLGAFNAWNTAAVLAVLLLEGLPFADALESLRALTAPAGRLMTLGGGKQPLCVVDFAHTPDALEQVLKALKAHCSGRLWVVFGCGGDRDAGKRPEMGALAEALADQVILTDDNPRSEEPVSIVEQIQSGMARPHVVNVLHQREQAIRWAIEQAGAGDVVLIAGKGHESYQQIGDLRVPFDDAAVVRRILSAEVKA